MKQTIRYNAIYAEYAGRSMTLPEMSRLTGIPRSVLAVRHNRGDRGAKLTRPVAPPSRKAK